MPPHLLKKIACCFDRLYTATVPSASQIQQSASALVLSTLKNNVEGEDTISPQLPAWPKFTPVS